MSLPTVTINEVSQGIQDNSTNAPTKKVLEGMLNDFMDLQYGKETPYTTGQRVLPAGATLGDVDAAIANDSTDKIYKPVFEKISDTEKSGTKTPQTNDGSWDPKLTPILVLIRPNN